MSSYISFIGVIDKCGLVHSVPFKQGLNVITGKSSTGKSALMEIFDYCFGSSEFTVPVGEITNHSDIYFVIFRMKDSYLVLARNGLQKKAFIKEIGELKIDDTGQPTFTSDFFNTKYFLPLSDFNKELGGYFGLNITNVDTDLESTGYRGIKSPVPSVRSFTSFMLQHQNLIANKHAVFYRFDEKEKREQVIEHIKIFLGLVDQEYFLLSQKLNTYQLRLRELNRNIPKIDQKRARIKSKIGNMLAEYNVISGVELEDFTAQKIMQNPMKWLEKLYSLEFKVDSASDKNSNFISVKEKERLNLTDKLRGIERQYRKIKSSIESTDRYQSVLVSKKYPKEISESVSYCPFCEAESNIIEKEANTLSDAIHWLNNELEKTPFVNKSFLSDAESIRVEIAGVKAELKVVDTEINDFNKNNELLKQRKSVTDQLLKIKLKIETYIEELIDSDVPESLEKEIKTIDCKIKAVKKVISSYNVNKSLDYFEKMIAETMNDIGSRLDFEASYQPINLKFSLQTFEIYHINKKSEKVFLRSMGSGANWLYTHLVLFMGLNKLFCTLKGDCLIPPILFIDQPTQVYFPNVTSDVSELFTPTDLVGTNKSSKVDDDIKSVENFFNEIITFCETTKIDTGVTPQFIVTDHADNLNMKDGRIFEDYVRARWRNRGFINIS
jgi:hypothetical protein